MLPRHRIPPVQSRRPHQFPKTRQPPAPVFHPAENSGSVSWLGRELADLRADEMKAVRKDLQILFQDPLANLDPRMTVSASIAEPLITHSKGLTADYRKRMVAEIMERVGLSLSMMNRYPHELSGGQNQRVGIARAMIMVPQLIICDEAVSALDVSVQAHILALLKGLRAEFGMAMIFISHDLSVVREVADRRSQIADRIMVLYLGRVVEMADRDQIFNDARHPYTRSLISAVLAPDPRLEWSRERLKLVGDLPSLADPGAPLRFLPSKIREGDLTYRPQLIEVSPGHGVAEHDDVDQIVSAAALA